MAGKYGKYLKLLMESLRVDLAGVPVLCYSDNTSAENLANKRKPSGRTRQIDIQWYAVQEWVRRGIVLVSRVSTSQNVSDALTKILGRVLHTKHCNKMMEYNGLKYGPF